MSAGRGDVDAGPPPIGFCGCVGLLFGATWGSAVGALVGTVAFERVRGEVAKTDATFLAGAAAGALGGAFLTAAITSAIGAARAPLSPRRQLVVLGLAGAAGLGTALSPIPSAWEWAPATAVCATAAVTIAAFLRVPARREGGAAPGSTGTTEAS